MPDGTNIFDRFDAPKSSAAPAVSQPTSDLGPYGDIYRAAADQYGLDPYILRSHGIVESGEDPVQVGKAGEMGLMQLMPGTARDMGVKDPFSAHDSIFGGAKYLRQQLDSPQARGLPQRAVSQYNSGPDGEYQPEYVRNIAATYQGMTGHSPWVNQPMAVAPPKPQAKAPNPFDQFDAKPAAAEKNPFDQFDAKPAGPSLGSRLSAKTHGDLKAAGDAWENIGSAAGEAARAGIAQNLRETVAAKDAVTGQPVNVQKPDAPYAQDFTRDDLLHPETLIPKLMYAAGHMVPGAAAGLIGSTVGGSLGEVAGPVGAVVGAGVGGAAGYGLYQTVHSLAPYYAEAYAQTKDPDKALKIAGAKALAAGAFSAVSWRLFEFSPFAGPVKNALFQMFVAQPALNITQDAANDIDEGKPPLQALSDAAKKYPEDVIQNAVPLAAFHLAGRAASGAPRAFQYPWEGPAGAPPPAAPSPAAPAPAAPPPAGGGPRPRPAAPGGLGAPPGAKPGEGQPGAEPPTPTEEPIPPIVPGGGITWKPGAQPTPKPAEPEPPVTPKPAPVEPEPPLVEPTPPGAPNVGHPGGGPPAAPTPPPVAPNVGHPGGGRPAAPTPPTPAPTPEPKPPIALPGPALKPEHALADDVANRLGASPVPISSAEMHTMAEQRFGGTLAQGAFGRDLMYDAGELGVNRYIQQHPTEFNPHADLTGAQAAVSTLEAIKNRMPTQSVRAGEKISHQQFSTPPDYAYAASWVANMGPGERVLEPSAGTGSLAVHALNAGADQVSVNELSEQRRGLLQHPALGFDHIFGENADHLNAILPQHVRPTTVLMNPPFSQTAGRLGDRMDTMVAANHIEQALQRLEPGGRLVAIVGRGMKFYSTENVAGVREGTGRTYKDWWDRIRSEYDVRANVGVSGDIYRKYGTDFGTRLLVIDKAPPSGREIVGGDVKSLHELLPALEGVRNDRRAVARSPGEQAASQPGGTPVAPPGGQPDQPVGGLPPSTGGVGPGPGSSAPSGEPKPAVGGSPGTHGGVSPGGRTGAGGPGGEVAPGGGEPPTPGTAGPTGAAPGGGGGPGGGGAGGAGTGVHPPDGGGRPAPGLILPADELAKLEAELNAKLNGRLHSGIDPELIPLAFKIATHYIAAGARKFMDFARQMVTRFGDAIRPMLRDIYNMVREQFSDHLPDMDSRQKVEDDLAAMEHEPPPVPVPTEEQIKTGEITEDQQNGGELSEDIYEDYKPQRVTVEGAQPHPGALVQSAAMATVLPPPATYRPVLAPEIISKGSLSDAQLEAVIYAGEAHSSMLGANQAGLVRRRGWFSGDGTGVGKGRQIAGIILDNFNQGRDKAVWLSQNMPLSKDAQRDWKGIGQDPSLIVRQSKFNAGGPITLKRGILFTSYSTLRGGEKTKKNQAFKAGDKITVKDDAAPTGWTPGTVVRPGEEKGTWWVSVIPAPGASPHQVIYHPENMSLGAPPQQRVDQIVKWLGKDFDGVIAFDEAHEMSNANPEQSDRGVKEASQQALAGLKLQNALPNARVIYVSATGATEVSNLAYADRLGLWGEGTAFANQQDFISKVTSGGVAAMELIARDLKALGSYMARNLSYKGVDYDRILHPLTDEQRMVYDKFAEGWQVVLKNMMAALQLTTGHTDGQGRPQVDRKQLRNIKSAFWGGHQRFFNQVITSMQLPTALTHIEKDLAEGRQVVLQIVNTNEAAQQRALAEARAEGADDFEELDMSPTRQLIELVRRAFPTKKYEPVLDPATGTVSLQPVLNAEGVHIDDPRAVAMKNKLLMELGLLPKIDGPLEMLANHFGYDKIAEITGRSSRLEKIVGPDGAEKTMDVQRPQAAREADANLFQEGKKPILIFSTAGSTGRSYHAEVGSGAADKRRSHYLLQAGWRASTAVQGFGRSHRSNQVSAPIFHLMTTDIEGQKRFISSIARRLGQLGALTKGERRTGDQGLFGPKDNLESPEATAALRQFYMDVVADQVPGVTMDDLEKQMGLKMRDSQGALLATLPPMKDFLNRLLSLKLGMQKAVFDAFSTRFDDIIDAARANGTLDVGTETFRADRIAKKEDRVVYTDPRSGAETRYVRLETSHKTKPVSFDEIINAESIFTGYHAPLFFIQNTKNGRLFAVSASTKSTTDRHGNQVTYYRVADQLHHDQVPQEKINDAIRQGKARELTSNAEVRPLWTEAFNKAPEFTKRQLHIITGAVLPIWDRLDGRPQVYRLQTDDGERMLGRVIPPMMVNDTLRNLGAMTGDAAPETFEPADVINRILQGGETARLSNGWTIAPVRVAGEQRMELRGDLYRYQQMLERSGVFMEMINNKTRAFIPTGERNLDVFNAVTSGRPVVSMTPRTGGGEGAGPGEDISFSRTAAPKVPLYSGVGRAVDRLPQAKGSGEQMLAMLTKQPGVKPEEMKWLGLPDWLRSQKSVTREQIADYVRANNLDVREVVKGGSADAGLTRHSHWKLPGGEDYRELLITLPRPETGAEERYHAASRVATDEFAKLKELSELHGANDPRALEQRQRFIDASRAKDVLQKEWGDERQPFKHGHWPDDEDVIAHVRFDTRVAPDGKRVLMLHELQSDWHQKGRKRGYRDPASLEARKAPARERIAEAERQRAHFAALEDRMQARLKDIDRQQTELRAQVLAAISSGNRAEYERLKRFREPLMEGWKATHRAVSEARGERYKQESAVRQLRFEMDMVRHPATAVPDAPFKTSWSGLIMRRMIKYAADNGFDRVAWAPGEEQTKRYSEALRKRVDVIRWEKTPEGVHLVGTKGDAEVVNTHEKETALSDAIGKTMAEKILGDPAQTGEIRGNEITISDTGMAGFYDRMLPAETNKIVGKYGAKVGQGGGPLKVGQGGGPFTIAKSDRGWMVFEADGKPYSLMQYTTHAEAQKSVERLQSIAKGVTVHQFDITPALLHAAQTEGMPLFQRQGAREWEDKWNDDTEDNLPDPRAVQAVIDAVKQMTGGHAEITVHDTAAGGFVMRYGSISQVVDGYQIGRIIRAALTDRVEHVLHHETWHFVRKALLSDAEWNAVKKQAERENWIGRHGIADRYGDLSREGQFDEAAAEQFAEWMKYSTGDDRPERATPPPAPTSLIGRLIARIRAFFARIRDALLKRGLRTVDDVFHGIESGEVGGRPMRSMPSMERSLTLEREHMLAHMGEGERPSFARGPRRTTRPPRPIGPVWAEPKGLSKALDEAQGLFAPTSRSPLAKTTALITVRTLAERERLIEQAMDRLEVARWDVQRLPTSPDWRQSPRLRAWDQTERGIAGASPDIVAAQRALRKALDDRLNSIQALGREIGKPLLEHAIEDYMGRAYSNYPEWSNGLVPNTPPYRARLAAQASAASNRPLRGSQDWRKPRSYEFLVDAMDDGLIPVTDNMVDMQLIKLRSMLQFEFGTMLAHRYKIEGIVHWVKQHEWAGFEKDGWRKMNDAVFNPVVFGVVPGGRTEFGAWMAPEPAARIFNNFVTPSGFGKSIIYDTFRKTSHAFNMAQLAFSGFHASFVVLDAATGTTALGLEQITRGMGKGLRGQPGALADVGRGVGNLAMGSVPMIPVSIARTMRQGIQLKRQLLTDDAALPPEAREQVENFLYGGARIKMGGFHSLDERGAFIRNVRDIKRLFRYPGDFPRELAEMYRQTPYAATFRIAMRLIHSVMEPIMGFLVPMAKVGQFSQMASDWMREHPGASAMERAEAMHARWQNVENRLGQMTYDNLFWKRSTKDTLFATVRSVGWNTGSVTEIAGAPVEFINNTRARLRGEKPDSMRRVMYVIALTVVTAQAGAIITYLNTGKMPESMLDLFYPPDGTGADGRGGRKSIPGYVKDIVAATFRPGQTLLNKLNPLFSLASQVMHNRNYYDDIISMPGEDNPIMAYGEYILGAPVPFAIQAMLRDSKNGGDMTDIAQSFLGFQPAPGYITDPDRAERGQNRSDRAAYKRRLRHEAQ